jgi:hypothetical protein
LNLEIVTIKVDESLTCDSDDCVYYHEQKIGKGDQVKVGQIKLRNPFTKEVHWESFVFHPDCPPVVDGYRITE